MQEDEIKLYVPAHVRKHVVAQLNALEGPRRQRMRALYFDTSECTLAQNRAALRVRQEGRRWVQTFKMEGPNLLTRIELNHPRSGPEPDLSVYRGTPAEPVLAGLEDALQVRYETDIRRMRRQISTRYGVVEVAYDVGAIQAGVLELPVYELEFERVDGSVRAVFELARQWVRDYGLVLDLRSKAERGHGLADVEAAVMQVEPAARAQVREQGFIQLRAAQRALPVETLIGDQRAELALDRVTTACFIQIARNASFLAVAEALPWVVECVPEYVHQLRVGIRRLRSAWRLFEGLTALPSLGLRLRTRDYFRRLGAVREADVFINRMVPALEAAGMPKVELASVQERKEAAALVQEAEFQVWLLDLMAWTAGVRAERDSQGLLVATEVRAAEAGLQQNVTDDAVSMLEASVDGQTAAESYPESIAVDTSAIAGSEVPPGQAVVADAEPDGADHAAAAPHGAATPNSNLCDELSKRLYKWHKRLVAAGRQYDSLDDASRHVLRKRVKRLRYSIDHVAGMFDEKRLKRYRRKLGKVQKLLGEANDLVEARAVYRGLIETQPQAWFALGWIAARLDMLEPRIQKAFKKLKRASPFPPSKLSKSD